MGMNLTKEFVNSCRKVGVLRDFLCQAIDQVDEKDKEIAELKEQYKDMDVTHTVHIAKMNARIEELEQKLQDQCMCCPVKMQEDDVVAEKDNEIRWLKRALWLARSYRGRDNSILLPSKFMRNVWDNVERKCRAKMEEYK